MKLIILLILPVFYIQACNQNDTSSDSMPDTIITVDEQASIVSVSTSGEENAYTFSVGIASPDTGCEQYANWWEVISENGDLLYRRILGHSHVNEQPFVRSGGAVSITSSTVVIIRAHMNTSGYGTTGYKGSVSEGFSEFIIDEGFASELTTQDPLPDGCAF